MDTEIITIYYICSEFIKTMNITQDPSARMSDCEVLATIILAAGHCQGNLEKARKWMKEDNYIPNILSKSRLNRRAHRFSYDFWRALLQYFADISGASEDPETIIDSFPVKACHNVRKSHLYIEEVFKGYNSSKDEYFTGIKAHVVTNSKGQPLDFLITPGSVHDLKALKAMEISTFFGKILYGDKAYNDYAYEDFLKDLGTYLLPQRKENSKRAWPYKLFLKINSTRKRIESSFSSIIDMLPRRIKAVTAKGFELKVTLGIVALGLRYVI